MELVDPLPSVLAGAAGAAAAAAAAAATWHPHLAALPPIGPHCSALLAQLQPAVRPLSGGRRRQTSALKQSRLVKLLLLYGWLRVLGLGQGRVRNSEASPWRGGPWAG